MKSFRLFLLCVTGLLFQAKAGQAQSTLTACTMNMDSKQRQQALADVQQRVTLMKIAASKADFKNLFAYINGEIPNLEGLDPYLEKCKAVPDLVLCDTDCHVQRAQAWLFMISELPVLDANQVVTQKIERGNDVKLIDEGFRRGLAIVEEGLNKMSRMNQARTALKPEDEDKPAPNPSQEQDKISDSFRGFLQDQARLQAVKVRLLLALGDRLYQNVSATRVATLKKRINDVLSNGTDPQKKGSELYQAETLYDQAFWVLQEAMIDIPKVGVQAEAFTLMGLKNDVDQRLKSVRNGYLFLNIDPEQFSTLSADDLMRALEVNMKNLEGLEHEIESIVKDWQSNTQDQGRRTIDDQRVRQQKDLEVDGYKIAELSAQSENLQNRYSQMLTNSSLAQQISELKCDLLNKRFYLEQINFELQQTKAEVQGQIDVLKRQADLEVTALDKEAAADRRDNFKWLIDMNLTNFNLTLQVKQLETQIDDLTAQIAMKSDEAKSLDANIGSRRSLISVEQSHMAELEQVRAQIEAKKDGVFRARRQGLVQNICGLLAERARLVGTSPGFSDEAGSCEAVQLPTNNDKEYWTAVLALRKKYFDPDAQSGTLVEKYKLLMGCLTKDQKCDGDINEIDAIKQIQIKEQLIWTKVTQPQLVHMKQQLQDHINALGAAKTGVLSGQYALAAVNIGAGLAWIAGAGKKVIATVTPGFEYDIGQQLQAGYQVAVDGAQAALEAYKYGKAIDSERDALAEQISEIEKELITLEATWNNNVQAMQANQAVAAIAGRRLELELGQETLKADYAEAILSAEYAIDQAKIAAKRIDAEIASIVAQLKEARAEKELLTFDTAIANKQADQSLFRIQSMQFEIKGLEIEKTLVAKDKDRLDRLKQAAFEQKGLTEKTQNSIAGLAKNVTSESQVVTDLRNKEKAGQTALSKSQIERLDAVLVQKTDYTAKAKKSIEDQIKLLDAEIIGVEGTQRLTEDFNQQLNQISGQIKSLSQSLVEKASQPDPTAGKETKLFLASEDLVADLTQGIPDFVAAKRQRLQYTNFLFNLYRNRMNTLSSIGDTSIPMNLVPYIAGSGDLNKAMRTLCKTIDGSWVCDPTQSLAFSETEVAMRSSEFTIPATSGFMSRLLSKGRVRFEITHDVMNLAPTDKEAMASSGYFMLWDDVNMSVRSNSSLVNIVVQSKFQDKQKCRKGVIVQVKHLGTGFRYTTTRGSNEDFLPILVTTPPVGKNLAILDADADSAAYKHYFDYFVSPFPLLRNFPESIPHHIREEQPVPLKFLGLPLIGAYEISMADQSPELLECLVGQPLQIGINYTDSLIK